MMEVVSWNRLKAGLSVRKRGVLTVGVFDGLHLGHQELINRTVASMFDGEKILITFANNPASLLHPEDFKGNLLSISQKLEKIENMGIDCVILIDFSEDFSKITGREFVKLLLNSIEIQKMVIGKDFRFGYHRTIGKENLGSLINPAQLEIVEPIDMSHHRVSSSRIRNLILEGRLKEAKELLGYAFSIDLRQVEKKYCSSTWQIEKKALCQLVPPSGEYDVFIETNKTRISGKVMITGEYLNIRTVSYNSCEEIDYITFD